MERMDMTPSSHWQQVQPPARPVANNPTPNLQQPLKCPRCDSTNTKFCYYNNYSLSQPRHFCKACKRYWTRGGTLRNVPVGGGCRKNKRAKKPGLVTAGPPSASSPPSSSSLGNPIAPQISGVGPHVPSSSNSASSFNPFLYNMSGTSNQDMGIGDYTSVLTSPPMIDTLSDLQPHDCTLLQDYSAPLLSYATKMFPPAPPSWLSPCQGGAYAGDAGLGLAKGAKEEGRFDPQATCGENRLGIMFPNLNSNQVWSSALSGLWLAEPTGLIGSSATAPLI